MNRNSVFADISALALNQGFQVGNHLIGYIMTVGSDPRVRHLLFRVSRVLYRNGLKGYRIGIVALADHRGHLTALAFQGTLACLHAQHSGLGNICGAGNVGRAALHQAQLNGTHLAADPVTYQLLQGYDFLHLYETRGCKLQLGGSDQWGNITTGAELIRRTNGGEVFALTCPLVTKADGTKFGKTESGNVWLDARYTSPYKFYQFWLNVSDEDAERYIKIFTSLTKEEIDALIAEHKEAPHLRVLQKRLAREVTVMVHSEEDYNAAVEASGILFGNATSDALKRLDEDTLLSVFEGVPQFEVAKSEIEAGIKAVDLFVEKAAIFPSKGEMRKMTQGGGVSLNKEKLTAFDQVITADDLLDEKYLLVQRGKKNYYLIIAK